MEDNYVDNLNEIRELSKRIKSMDLINPSSHIITVLSELLERCKHIPELEMMDPPTPITQIEAEA
jgi:hypothetical protein